MALLKRKEVKRIIDLSDLTDDIKIKSRLQKKERECYCCGCQGKVLKLEAKLFLDPSVVRNIPDELPNHFYNDGDDNSRAIFVCAKRKCLSDLIEDIRYEVIATVCPHGRYDPCQQTSNSKHWACKECYDDDYSIRLLVRRVYQGQEET